MPRLKLNDSYTVVPLANSIYKSNTSLGVSNEGRQFKQEI